MSDVGLMFHNLFRKPLRTILMIVSIFIAFFIFTMLATVSKAFNAGADLAAADRLVTVNKINFTVSLPYAYINRIRAIEGVRNASWANWFGGYYQERRNFLQTFAVEPETYLNAYPELVIPEDQRAAFIANRSGLLIGEAIAREFGWSVGDTVPIRSDIYSNADTGGDAWEFEIEGVFAGDEANVPTNYVLFHWERYNESVTFGRDEIGFVIINTDDPSLNDEVIRAIDAQFANSIAETETTTEEAFNKAFLAQLGNISLIINSVVGAAFATILTIVGTTMVLAIRERTKEIAVLKTLGFRAGRLFRMVLGETILLSLLGGLFGVGAAALLLLALKPLASGFLPGLAFTPDTAAQAVAIMLALGLITGLAPAFNAVRVNIVAALGKD